MKLVKMSLAAIIAAGAMTTVASATPLEEAIKGVDVSGYLRYRYTNTHVDKLATDATHGFKSVVTLKTPVQDNFQAVLTLGYSKEDGSGSDATTYVGDAFNVKHFYGAYTVADTTFMFGKQAIGAYFTDDMKATGLKVVNTSVPGWTFAGIAFDALQKDGDVALVNTAVLAGLANGGVAAGAAAGATVMNAITSENLYGVAAIGSLGPVSLQLWAASVVNIGNMYAIDVQPSFEVGGFKLGLIGQFGMFDADSDLGALGITDGQLFILAGAMDFGTFNFSAGYANYEADEATFGNTKVAGVSTVTLEDNGQFAKPGEQLLAYNNIVGENEGFFLTAGVKVADFNLGAEYITAEAAKFGGSEVDADEYVARASYKFNKNLTFKSYYSYLDTNAVDSDKFRFEAKYSF